MAAPRLHTAAERTSRGDDAGKLKDESRPGNTS